MSRRCGECGRAKPEPKKRKMPRGRIALTGRVPAEQRQWYDEAMRVKRGELVWSPLENWDRFGAPGGYVTPDRAVDLEARAADRLLAVAA